MARTPALRTNNVTTSVLCNDVQKTRIDSYFRSCFSNFPIAGLREKLQWIDFSYYMERHPSTKVTEVKNVLGILYKDLELPIVQPNCDAAHAKFVDIFLSSVPIFGIVSESIKDDKKNMARQMEAIITENASAYKWKRQLWLTLLDLVKFNIGGASCEWNNRVSYSVKSKPDVNMFQGQSDPYIASGNKIESFNMYNTIWDLSTAPADISSSGDFVCTVKNITEVQVMQLYKDIITNNGIVSTPLETVIRSTRRRNFYFIPSIIPPDRAINGKTNWSSWFQTSFSNFGGNVKPGYELVIFYARIVPSSFGFFKVPAPNEIQIWKFYEINGHIVLAEVQTNAHDKLPGMFGQPKEDKLGLQTKGTGETLLNFQNLSGSLFRARMNSLAQGLSDRGIYNPNLIDRKDLESSAPVKHIALRSTAITQDVRAAYQPIPYNDFSGQIIAQEIPKVAEYASEAAHINRADRGQFQKGNKTQGEFNKVMDNSDATQLSAALLLDEQFFADLKYQIKFNVLQYQASVELPDPYSSGTVQVNPADLRNGMINYKIVDGLISKDKILNIDQMIEAGQIMAQVPGGNDDYDVVGILGDALEAKGAKIFKYKRTPEEKQARLIQAQQMNAEPPAPGTPPAPQQ